MRAKKKKKAKRPMTPEFLEVVKAIHNQISGSQSAIETLKEWEKNPSTCLTLLIHLSNLALQPLEDHSISE
jgi:hypothetical protein